MVAIVMYTAEEMLNHNALIEVVGTCADEEFLNSYGPHSEHLQNRSFAHGNLAVYEDQGLNSRAQPHAMYASHNRT